MKIFDYIAAKSNFEDNTKWLSFRTHALDTAGIITKLYHEWLSDSIKKYMSQHLHLSNDDEQSDCANCNFCRLLALLHDIGKITPAFQSRIAGNIENYSNILSYLQLNPHNMPEFRKSPHALAGQVILEEYGFPEEISIIIGSHHGKSESSDCNIQLNKYRTNYFGDKGKQEQEWRSLWEKWIDYVLKDTGFVSVEHLPKPDVKIQMLLTGLLIMADWIASNTEYFPYTDIETVLNHQKIQERLFQAWKILGLPEKWEAELRYDLHEFFQERFGFLPNTVQDSFMNIVSENYESGIYILEAPMGIGKTEAALAVAEILAGKSGASGIFFGLPTQATANGIFGRICDWTENLNTQKHAIRLAHGMTALNHEYQALFHGTATDSGDESLIVHEWFEGRKQALLSDFVIATVDQFLLASLKQKHVMFRHLGLSGKVVIIDECHAYDAYMNIYLDHTLTWMGAYQVPVIILSATLPPKRRMELVKAYLNQRKMPEISQPCDAMAYPVLTWTNGTQIMQKKIQKDKSDKYISVMRIYESDLTALLLNKLSEGGCAGVIVNTVNHAQQLSRELSKKLPDFEIICFHSRFIATDRAETEKFLLKRVGKYSAPEERNKLIVIGTQVLEQSLDIDFDYMITELCPMDLLLQRSGRLHRHDRIRPEKLKSPELTVLYPDEEHKNVIYSEWILHQTEKYLPDYLSIPECIPELISKVYDASENIEETEHEMYQKYCDTLQEKQRKAKKYCIDSGRIASKRYHTLDYFLNDDVGNSQEAEASVRDTDETIEVLVLQKVSAYQYCLISEKLLFDITQVPDDEGEAIARQRLRLPRQFSQNYNFSSVIKALDIMPKIWRDSKWLKGELLLLLDENAEAELLGERLYYSQTYGLEIGVSNS